MPFVNIRIAPASLDRTEVQQLIDQTTTLMRDVMGKKAERTTIHIQPEDAELWAVGGTRISELNGRAVFMDIKVTTGTNTTTDKEDMVRASSQMLQDILGTLPNATYIVIDEIPGESWGKAGKMLFESAAADRAVKRS